MSLVASSLKLTHDALAKAKKAQEEQKAQELQQIATALTSNVNLKTLFLQLELFRKIINEKESKTEYLQKIVAPTVSDLVAVLVANLPSKSSLSLSINNSNVLRLTAIIRAAYTTFIVAEKKKKIKDAKISKDPSRDNNALSLFKELDALSSSFISASTDSGKYVELAKLYLSLKSFYDFAINLDTLIQSESKSGSSDYVKTKSSYVGATYLGILYLGEDQNSVLNIDGSHSINSSYFPSA